MIGLGAVTRRADADGIDAGIVERDYVLTQVMSSLAAHDGAAIFQFKGGTSLRLCYFEDYRYSADIDLNVDPAATVDVYQVLRDIMRETRDRVGFPHLELTDEARPVIAFIGPLRSERPRRLKIDLTLDEYVVDRESTASILPRYNDQPAAAPLRTYGLAETVAEKLRCVMQRLQCRDLYDIWFLTETDGVDLAEVKSDFAAKASHRGFDPDAFAARFSNRIDEYRHRWYTELGSYMSGAPNPDTVVAQVSQRLRRAGYL